MLLFLKRFVPLCIVSLLLLCIGCIQEEAPNAECDIISAFLNSDAQTNAPVIENDIITFYVKPTINFDGLAPEFELTHGASIFPESGTERDFSTPQYYTVTSEDKNWSKTYQVRFYANGLRPQFHFENFELKDSVKNRFYVFYEEDLFQKQYVWATANEGYKINNQSASEDEYPSVVEPNGYIGNGVKLVTRSTGALGNMVKMPIAAGNLFLGKFNVKNAMSDPLGATQFGTPFTLRPQSMRGWYKYQPGFVVKDKNNKVLDKIDQFDIYAVLYEPTEDMPYLNGGNILTDNSIVAVARVEDRMHGDDFVYFDIPFVYRDDKLIDEEKLADFKYHLAVIFTSSINGAYFEGAVGSTLVVDEVEIVCQQTP